MKMARGHGKSLSAFVSEAVEANVQRDELAAILDAMDLAYGKPRSAAEQWAKRVLRPSSSTRARRSPSSG